MEPEVQDVVQAEATVLTHVLVLNHKSIFQFYTILRLFRPIGLQYLQEIMGQRSLCGQNQFELYKREFGMASSIKSQGDNGSEIPNRSLISMIWRILR